MFQNKLPAAAVLALMALLGLASPSYAGTAAMACVQQGLSDSGFDANGIDGAFGNGTRTAAQAYLEANPDSSLPTLSSEEAVAGEWCKALGAHVIILALEDIPMSADLEFLFFLLDNRQDGYGDRQEYMVMDVDGEPQRVLIYESSVTEKLKGACFILFNDVWTDADLEAGDACSGINTRPFYGEQTNDNGLYTFSYPVWVRAPE